MVTPFTVKASERAETSLLKSSTPLPKRPEVETFVVKRSKNLGYDTISRKLLYSMDGLAGNAGLLS